MTPLSNDALISYHRQGDLVAIRLPKYALVEIDTAHSRLTAYITPACLAAYGVFEDVLMISLAPLYRQRGWYPLHAFAGLAPNGKAALITGNIGAGKTTTGLALLSAGWKLLSNDSPLLTTRKGLVEVLAYPGRLSAFDDSLARFESLKQFIPPAENQQVEDRPQKRVFRAEEAFVDPWAEIGVAGGLFFPTVVPGLTHSRLRNLPAKQALLELIPQAVESWDKAAIGQTLQLLRQLVEQVPAYILELAPDMEAIPALIATELA